jgi:hypothetical protein
VDKPVYLGTDHLRLTRMELIVQFFWLLVIVYLYILFAVLMALWTWILFARAFLAVTIYMNRLLGSTRPFDWVIELVLTSSVSRLTPFVDVVAPVLLLLLLMATVYMN